MERDSGMEPENNAHVTDEPRVFIFEDGRHAASLYQFESPITPADLTYNVDQLASSGLDTLIYFAGTEGGVVLYDSEVAQTWGDNVVKWTHSVWYRAGRNLRQLIADGCDPLQLLCERCERKGVWFIAGNWVNFQGADRETDGGLGRKSDFVFDHPHFQVGEEEDPRAQYVEPRRFSFLYPEVRQERFAVFEELLSRYPTDGIELDLIDFAPLCRFDEVEQLDPVLTGWIGDLRRVADRAESEQGRRKRIYARIPAHPDAWNLLGYDVPAWVREGLVDGLICMSGQMEGAITQDLDLGAVADLVRDTQCRLLVGCSNLLGRQRHHYAPAPMIWAAAANAYSQGADGIGLANAHWGPNGWPWRSDEYHTLRLLGHPDMLATADKIYRVRSQSSVGKSSHWMPGDELHLPRTLVEGEPVRVPLRISDDVARAHALGRIESICLRVRITAIEPSLNEVRVKLNEQQLPDSILQLNDLGYRLIGTGAVGPYGCVYEYHLTPAYFPRPGPNSVEVTLLHHDPDIDISFDVWDVDCAIRYRLHRNFRREPIDY